MSIIEEALRRVQDPLLPPAKKAPAPAPDRPAAPERRPVAHPWQQAAPSSPAASTLQPQTAPLTAVALAVLLLTTALIIGGALWIGRALSTAPRDGGAPVQAPIASPPAPAFVEFQRPIEPEPEPEEAKPAHPKRPRSTPRVNAGTPGLVLSGVVEGLGDPYAVINGLIVTVGERVGDATLEQIAQGSVTLRHDDGRQTILRVPR